MENDEDIKRLVAITQTMLGHLEKVLEISTDDGLGRSTCSPEIYDRIFGSKSSYVSILVDLAGLMLKLKTVRLPIGDEGLHDRGDDSTTGLNLQDTLLINEFFRRQRNLSVGNS